jgi:hypothetical protein
MSASPSFSFTRKPLSVTVRLASPPRCYTVTQLPLVALAASLALLLLYLMIPPWITRLARNLTLLLTSAGMAYLAYTRLLLTPASASSGQRKQQPIFPSVYEAPGGHKSAISWSVDPAEQERIDRLRGGSSAAANGNSKKGLAAVLEEEEAEDAAARSRRHAQSEPEESKTSEDEDEKARRALSYSRVHGELLHTEQTYTAALQTCVDCYIQPLQQRCNSGELKLSPQELSSLFSNLSAILSFHLLLLSDLQQTSSDSVGSVFLKYADYLKMYSVYVSNYSACLSLMSRLSMQKDFARFLQQQRGSRGSSGLDLMSFLIQPIQRIPRYEMLLTQLVKYAPYASSAASLSSALAKVHSIAVLVNERKREAENASFILELQHRMRGREVKDSLLQPSRKLVRVGEVAIRKDGKPGGKEKKVVWLLLTDLLVVCKEDYEWKEEIRQKDVLRVEEAPSGSSSSGDVCIVYRDAKGKEQRMLSVMPDDDSRQSWLCSLKQYHSTVTVPTTPR